MADYGARLLVKLAPESMQRTPIRAGAFLSAYELIKLQVIDGVRDSCWTGVLSPDVSVSIACIFHQKYAGNTKILQYCGRSTPHSRFIAQLPCFLPWSGTRA